jgi:MraZ protein
MATAALSDDLLWGWYQHSLDDKGRVVMPQSFRDKLGEKFVLAAGCGRGNHIRLYTYPVWNRLQQQFASRNVYDEFDSNLVILQSMLGNSAVVSCDQQDRLTIPPFLREHAGFKGTESPVIVGYGTRLEIWKRETYDQVIAGQNENLVMNAAENHRRRTLNEDMDVPLAAASAAAIPGITDPDKPAI